MQKTLAQLSKVWRGPAIVVKADTHTQQLGKGTPKATVIVHMPSLLRRLMSAPSLAFGEAYMRGDITVEGDLLAVLEGYYRTSQVWREQNSVARLFWSNGMRRSVSPRRALANARHHYDLGNDFYKLWLDPALVYSGAYFSTSQDTLAHAQQQKLELLCRKLRLHAGNTLLDIGCGWGSVLFYAAEHYGVTTVGITASQEQARYIEVERERRGVTKQVKVIVGDWRELSGTYDRVVSVGMFEHVGQQHYAEFFTRWRALLAPDGVSLLHTIGSTHGGSDPWISRYIFPGGYLPNMMEILQHASAQELLVADVENLWQHYALTLKHWAQNFAVAREQVVGMYDEQFARMWWLYLQASEAGFRWGPTQLWQFVILPTKASVWPLVREVDAAHPLSAHK